MSESILKRRSGSPMTPVAVETDARQSSVYANRFRAEATEVLEKLRCLFSEILARLETRRPVDLQRKLKLDLTLSWQFFRVAGEGTLLASGASMPSRANVEKFARGAAANGVDADHLARLFAAYERFEEMVERHAGDRTTFISLITSVAGLSDEWISADLQHRRNMYRGMSHVVGVQARTRLACYVLVGDSGPIGTHAIAVSGYVGLRALREIERIRVHGMRIKYDFDDSGDPLKVERQSERISGKGSLIEEFCSQPMPNIRVDSDEVAEERWWETSVLHPEVGILGTTTVMFADPLCGPGVGPTPVFAHQLAIPSEILIQDLMVPTSLMDGEPSLEVFLGDDWPTNRASDLMPILGLHRVERLGRGTDVLATPEVPNYGEMMKTILHRTALTPTDFEVWRVRLEYPIHQSKTRLTCKLRQVDERA